MNPIYFKENSTISAKGVMKETTQLMNNVAT